jgi:hypothetical protein
VPFYPVSPPRKVEKTLQLIARTMRSSSDPITLADAMKIGEENDQHWPDVSFGRG